MRVGVEVSFPNPGHNWTAITVTVDYWTENQHTYGDTQTLAFTGSITGSQQISNNQGAVQTKRATKTFDYTYNSGDYGPGPAATRTVGAKITGTYNGSAPSCSHVVNIPNRPYGTPAAPTMGNASYVSDTKTDLSWTRHETTGEPYDNQVIQRNRSGAGWVNIATVGGGATSYTDTGVTGNNSYQWRIKASNGIGDSGWDTTPNTVYNTPDPSDNVVRTTSGANQVITWDNTCNYPEFSTEVWHAAGGVWDSSPLATVAGPGATYTHVGPSGSVKHKYRTRVFNSSGVRKNSGYSDETTETAGATSAPSAPTGLNPTGTIDGSVNQTLKWTHNPTDGSAQTKYTLQHRTVGAGTWTTVGPTNSAKSQYVLAASSYGTGVNVEWHVLTYGADPNPSAYSSTATFTTLNPATQAKYPLQMDPVTGQIEALSTGFPSGGGGSFPGYGAATANTGFGTSKVDGAATTVSRSDHLHGEPTHDAAAHSAIPLSALGAAAANVSMGGFEVTNGKDPTSATSLATKQYVDTAIIARYTRPGNTTVADQTDVPMNFNTKIEDNASPNFCTVLPSTTLTVPTGCAGWYLITAGCYFQGQTTPAGTRILKVTVNGVQRSFNTSQPSVNNINGNGVSTSVMVRLAAGDTIQITARHTQGADVIVDGSIGQGTHVELCRLAL